ncbi:MAG: long-chain fatty aldehyde decarbonylase [Nitrospirales bacterium]|nr:long-chain fatty aldehyde decarbonylase [Nitrospirales bacterium]
MLVKPGEHVHLAQLLQFMVLGEQLAHDCAKGQATLVREPGMQRFLAGQAKQEGRHAVVFQWAIRWLAPRGPQSLVISDQMNQYRRLLTSALTRGDVVESLLAEQIILEGLGQAILQRLETGLLKRDAPFRKLRQILLQQEEAHHGFGLRTIKRMVADGHTSIDHMREVAPTYLELGKSMLFSAQDSFHSIQEDPQEYWKDFQRGLPVWLQEHPQDSPFEPNRLHAAR